MDLRWILFIVLILTVVRSWISRREDDALHLADAEMKSLRQQTSVPNILDQVDRWGKILTVILPADAGQSFFRSAHADETLEAIS